MIQIEKDRFRPNETYFVEHHNRPGWWVYQGSFPYAICTIIPNEDWSVIEMHHVIVFDEHQRRKGHGTRMIANVEEILSRGNNLGRHVGSFKAILASHG